jgi:NADPH-dependent F420 reductase
MILISQGEYTMRIAIIGTGSVGSTLGARWAQKGHQVIYGARDPQSDKVKNILDSQKGVDAKGIKEAASESEVVVFAIPWPAAEEAVKSAGDLKGKIVIDCTNPLAPQLSGLSVGLTTSAGEKVAEWADGAYVVKAFNNTGYKNMGNPVYGSESLSMFICGDDPGAKKKVSTLVADLDFDVVDCGGIKAARYLEPLAMLWIHLAVTIGMGDDIGFRLLRR